MNENLYKIINRNVSETGVRAKDKLCVINYKPKI